jgi:cyclase
MLKNRLIAVIIVLDGKVVQSIRFKHTNVIHYDAIHAAEAFSSWSVDEIVVLDVTRSPEGRDRFPEVLANISKYCFVPLTAGGWITDEAYAQQLLRSGADKLCMNTIFAKDPELVRTLSRRYGRQCIVASIDVKRDAEGIVRPVVNRGREFVDETPANWARRAQELGAGEILFNSVDHDGARRGYDIETLRQILAVVEVPVIAFGGAFTWQHLVEGIQAGCDAVAAANIFHYVEQSTKKAKSYMAEAGIAVRREGRFRPNPSPVQ